MVKDFQRKGSSAEDGAAPKRTYRKREESSFGNGFRKKSGNDDFDKRESNRGFRRSEGGDFGRRDDRGFRRSEGRDFERRDDRGFRRREGRDFGRRDDRGGFDRSEERGFRRSGGFSRKEHERPSFEPNGFRSERRRFESDSYGDFRKSPSKNVKSTFKEARKIYKREVALTDEVRLNKFIANSGICSRREADNYIQAGLITVNGTTVTELGVKVKPTDDIRFNGERLLGESKVYIVMNKPKDYVTTTSDPHAEKTVMDLLTGCKHRVFPVGRLDRSTTGVLLFTNDGNLAEKLTHPSYNKKKIYQVTLDRKLSKQDFDSILKGIELPDGEIHADELAYIDNDQHVVGVSIHSGRNRIIRRIFESLGYKVTKLDRVYFAGLTKKRLRKGEWRYLSEKEVNMLMMGAYE